MTPLPGECPQVSSPRSAVGGLTLGPWPGWERWEVAKVLGVSSVTSCLPRPQLPLSQPSSWEGAFPAAAWGPSQCLAPASNRTERKIKKNFFLSKGLYSGEKSKKARCDRARERHFILFFTCDADPEACAASWSDAPCWFTDFEELGRRQFRASLEENTRNASLQNQDSNPDFLHLNYLSLYCLTLSSLQACAKGERISRLSTSFITP